MEKIDNSSTNGQFGSSKIRFIFEPIPPSTKTESKDSVKVKRSESPIESKPIFERASVKTDESKLFSQSEPEYEDSKLKIKGDNKNINEDILIISDSVYRNISACSSEHKVKAKDEKESDSDECKFKVEDESESDSDECKVKAEDDESESDSDDVYEDSDKNQQKDSLSKCTLLCPICWKDFRHKPHLRRHILSKHKEDNPPLYYCAPCKEKIYSAKKFTEHFKKCEFGFLQKRIFKCSRCDLKFPLLDSCRRHEISHNSRSEKSFVCGVCGKAFRLQKTLSHHISMHVELQKCCKICGRPFRKDNDLKRHMMTHDNKVPYLCTACKIGFTEKTRFRKHMKKVHRKKKNCQK